MKRQWYRIEVRNQAPDDGDVADIYVYDEIGRSFWNDEAVTAKQFIDELGELPESVKTLRLHVNSPGGDPFEATAIANTLRAQRTEKKRTVDVSIEGLAASAATIITSAGNPIRIADNALFMIHDPWGLAVGTAAEMRAMAEALDRIRDAIIATYRWTSDLEAEEISALMAAETWMNAAEAVERGFATEITESLDVAASFRPEAFNRLQVPEAHRARVEALIAKPESEPAPEPEPAPPAAPAASAVEVLRLCREGECLDLAEDLVGAEASVDQVQARVSEERRRRQAAAARETEIRAICEAASLSELADAYVAGGMGVAGVRAQLTVITARLDKAEIDTGLPPEHGARAKPVIDVTAVYAQLNAAKE